MPDVLIIDNDVITSVELDIRKYNGIDCNCIRLNFKKEQPKYKNPAIFDNEGGLEETFAHAKKFVNKNVKIYCWDPIDQPGKHSKDNWYYKILEIEKNDSHILDKGPCLICGIKDNFVNFTKNNGRSWMHFKCYKFNDH